MKNLYIDFEDIINTKKTIYAPICCSIFDNQIKSLQTFDLRKNYDAMIKYLKSIDVTTTRFIGYAITTTEIPLLCQIMGRDWVKSLTCVDLWTEFKMFALTHQDYYTKKTGMLEALRVLGIRDEYNAEKEETRDLILYNPLERLKAQEDRKTRLETGDFFYTDEEFAKICKYCEEDVLILPKIYKRIFEISKPYPIEQKHHEARGRHTKYAGIAHYYQKGYPMDVDRVKKVFENIPKIKEALQINCNNLTNFAIYEPQYKGPQKNKIFTHYQFNMKNLGSYLKSKNLYEKWEKTKTGLKLKSEYLDEMLSIHRQELEPLYHTRNTIKQLNSTNLASILTEDGYIKSESWPFNQKTSRTSPKPAKGFILNLTPWLRMFIKPKKGRAFVSIDYKTQEVLVAACVSQDDSMLEDYLTDIFLGAAIKTGFAEMGATKKTHPVLREKFKGIVHGTNFGMAEESLSFRFFDLFKSINEQTSIKECLFQARKFLKNHEKVYYKYHAYVKSLFKKCKSLGYFQTLDDWFYFTDKRTKETQLKNNPAQTGGAAITRLAHDICVAQEIDAIQLHDALSFNCAEEDAIPLAKRVSKIMCYAASKILGYDHMSTETKIYTHECPYFDARGEQIYRFVMKELNLDCPEKFVKPTEIANIHLL